MSGRTDELIETLAADARPVKPLGPPLRRALMTLAVLLLVGAVAAALAGDVASLRARYAGRESLMLAEMAAMLATAGASVVAAFMLTVPGAARRWLLAPAAPFLAWLALSGLGCYGDFKRLGTSGFEAVHSADCLLFILGAGAFVGAPLLWRLARARPIDPLPVALLGGLGAAALAALLLQFFHPFAVTFADLAIHLAAVLIVVAITALARRRLLAPA